MKFEVGQRVRLSDREIHKRHNYWLSLGREPMKSSAASALDKAVTLRGTVVACAVNRFGCEVVSVRVDGETGTHESLVSVWEKCRSDDAEAGFGIF